MPMPAKKPATTPIPVQVSKSEFNPFILPHLPRPRFDAVVPDVKLATTSHLSPKAQDKLQQKAKVLADVFQRSSSNVEGRNGYLSLRNHQLRGLDLPRKRECLTAIHNFFLIRPDGATAAERFFGQKPRSMFAAILALVELPPAPLSPPRRP